MKDLAQVNIEEIIQQSDRYNSENITQVQQLKDISPLGWSYEAVPSLAQKYGCVKGFDDGIFQCDRAMTEFI